MTLHCYQGPQEELEKEVRVSAAKTDAGETSIEQTSLDAFKAAAQALVDSERGASRYKSSDPVEHDIAVAALSEIASASAFGSNPRLQEQAASLVSKVRNADDLLQLDSESGFSKDAINMLAGIDLEVQLLKKKGLTPRRRTSLQRARNDLKSYQEYLKDTRGIQDTFEQVQDRCGFRVSLQGLVNTVRSEEDLTEFSRHVSVLKRTFDDILGSKGQAIDEQKLTELLDKCEQLRKLVSPPKVPKAVVTDLQLSNFSFNDN